MRDVAAVKAEMLEEAPVMEETSEEESNKMPKEESEQNPVHEGAKDCFKDKAKRSRRQTLELLLEKPVLPRLMQSSKRCSTMTKVMARCGMGSNALSAHSDFSALNIDVQPSALSSAVPKNRLGATGLMSHFRSGEFARQVTMPVAMPSAKASAEKTAASSNSTAKADEFTDFRSMALGYRSLAYEKPAELEAYAMTQVSAPYVSRGSPQGPSASPVLSALAMPFPMQRQLTAPPAFARQLSTADEPRRQTSLVGPASSPKATLSPSSANAWRVGSKQPLDKIGQMKRDVQGMLNKICPESMKSIAEKISKVSVSTPDELEVIIELIFKKALAEPHYCETYADLVYTLKSSFPEFPNPDGGRPITFRASVLNVCQNEFESLPTALEPTETEKEQFDEEEIEFRTKQKKARVLANMKFIGHLFLRQLLSVKVIGSVMQELILCNNDETLPQEHAIECACELLMSVGYTLENMPAGQHALSQVCDRLLDLQLRKTTGPDGKKGGALSKRIQFCIQDILDTRRAGWTKKSFKSAAKTKEEIRQEQIRDLSAQAAEGASPTASAQIIAGQRPVYLASP